MPSHTEEERARQIISGRKLVKKIKGRKTLKTSKLTLADLTRLLAEAKRKEKVNNQEVKKLKKQITQEKKKRKVDKRVRKATGQTEK